jgi:polysaccharide pyruvyl transferase WcaK-like protein
VAKRIGLFGLFGAGNAGNDGSLEAVLTFLREARPDAEITCICANTAKVEKQLGVRSIRIGGGTATGPIARALSTFPPMRKLVQAAFAFRRVRDFDVIIVPGTGILDDFAERWWGMPASLLVWNLAAKVQGTKVAFMSVGAGPIDHPLSRWLMRSAAKLAQYRSYRDQISKDYMISIGLRADDPVYPDVAFRLAQPPVAEASPETGPLTVGVGAMAYFGWRGDGEDGATIYGNYLDKMSRFVLWLLDQGHRVRLLMGETSDERAMGDLLKLLAEKRPDFPRERVAAEPAYTLHDVMREMAKTDIVVATRFHNVVCALKLARPTASIGYAEKNDALMKDMGLGEFCQHAERLDVERLIEQFKQLQNNRSAFQAKLRKMNATYRDLLAHQERVLLEKFL